ncbi:amino acid ABC transporter substrate-binding protein, PAAT family [Stigmatella erecta]|uniref:Amino acid ABC transporter substrate-binding protein, PAAT family n=2 Tax=Stigmatella erecta TaxID=83460 RepID=A0A1I0JL77_9BACT|nr:amino acid ABC transporter substrate-binding protein, PAAT family [Stigmatella erecta]
MKLLIQLVALTLCLTATVSEARTFEEIKKDGKIIVATEGGFPPFNFYQGPTLTGFEVEVAEALAKKMGVKIEWRALAFDALLAGLRQDRWDMVIASFGITPQRSKAVSFTDPHYCSGGVVVAKDPAIRTAQDLSGKVVAVQTGTTYLESVQKLPGVKEVKNFPKDTDARSALASGRVDAWVTDKFVAKAALESSASAGLKLGDFVFVEKIAPAVKKGNTSLVEAVNKALQEIMADGTYEAISKKYLKEDIRCR